MMLGSRTKQINSYGKRSRRVIDATDDSNRPLSKSEVIISIFDDMPPAPAWKSVASKMKKRENTVPTNDPKPKPPLPKVVGLQRRKRLSPVLSPIRRKPAVNRVAQILGTEGLRSEVLPAIIMKPKPKRLPSELKTEPMVASGSPPRAPLSAFHLNLPGSPAVSHHFRQKARIPSGKATPLKSSKPFSPFVDMDIIVLDDEGRTIRKEHRVTRTDVDINTDIPPCRTVANKPAAVLQSDSEESESEIVSQPRRPRRQAARKQAIVISDDSDEEDTPQKPAAPTQQISKVHKKPLARSSGLSHTSSQSVIEVVIPPAPYRIHHPTDAPAPRSKTPPPEPRQQVIRQALPQPDAHPAPTRYNPLPSPILKPRQLTPIRGRHKRLFDPPSPPSPTTPTDFDLSIDFSDLCLGSPSQTQDSYRSEFQVPEYLKPLLEECHQETCGPHNFSAFIESFPFDSIFENSRGNDDGEIKFKKIGEASYSEVFGIGDVVLKIIPLRDEAMSNIAQDDGPAPTDAKDVRKEIIVTRAMGEVYDGFVKLLKTYVVRGRYPEVLLQLWDEYNERKGSESVRPDTFKVSQVYAIIVLPNGGPDLEAYTFHNASRSGWRQASSLFWQVAKALAHAEHLVSFEHRDLHWGQILVRNLPTQANALRSLNTNSRAKGKTQRVFMDDPSHGVQGTLIDLGLSRMDGGDGADGERVHWTPFDEEVFMGEGDYQFDVYRMMRELTGGKWDEFHPITNVLWLHYVLVKLLHSKGLKPPAAPRKTKTSPLASAPPTADAAFSEKDCYDCLVDIESWLSACIADIAPSHTKATVKGKGRRKTQAPTKSSSSLGPARAAEIVGYGVKKGWIKPTQLS
ncbi:hypothetical protein B0H34DRAFT_689542 [Crassisporium funariophilum]|nr:hypothetical protein B0H34DRAFT_689542 [Crassisporium funariophilum]